MNAITVFTKPWKDDSLTVLARRIESFGVDGVELAVRDGYQVTPQNVATELVNARDEFGSRGLAISSIAAPIAEPVIRAMGEAKVRILRVCVAVDMGLGYMESVSRFARDVARLVQPLRESGVVVGIQNHYDFMIGSALGIMHALEQIPDGIACAVLDLAHCALDGEPVELAIDIARPRMELVNFKSAYRFRTNGPDEPEASWKVLWSTGRHGGFSWRQALAELKRIGYEGDICLPAEYGRVDLSGQLMGEEVVPRLLADVRYLRNLLELDANALAGNDPLAADWESSEGR